MGCGPSMRNNAIHPVTSKWSNSDERSGITTQDPESTEPPPSTPLLYEPEEIPFLPGQPHNDNINYGSQQPHALLGALQDALQGRKEKQRRRLRWQPRITEDFTYPTSNNATDSAVEQSTAAGHGLGGTIYSDSWGQHSWGQDRRWPVGNGFTVDPFARLPRHPLHSPSSCSHFCPDVPAKSPLRLYGTDSQVEFFKMLDKKINEGPDYAVSDSENSG